MNAWDQLLDDTIAKAFFFLCERGCTATPEAVTAIVSFAMLADLPEDQVALREMRILVRSKALLGGNAVKV
jgi:hypothetical protein